MLDDLIDEVIKIDLDNMTTYNFPLDKPFGLEIIHNNKKYEFILKLSKNNNLIIFCKGYDDIDIIMDNQTDFLNQDYEINKLNNIIAQKDEEISRITHSKEDKINNLNDMIIKKDNILFNLTSKIEELTNSSNSKDVQINELEKKIQNQIEFDKEIEKLNNKNADLDNKAKELSDLISEKQFEIETLKTDNNKISSEYESHIKESELEISKKEAQIEGITQEKNNMEKELTDKIDENKTMSEEIEILKLTIEKNNSNIDSLFKEIDLLKSIISEKDKTIDTLKGR
ncbi:hypothetical protein [Methanobrevibacter sp.]|uniref:hypothetical protein n=1 Tax=Methanobrevibacter sp. TaxID=66852 RepID=UPI00386E456D